MCISIHVRSGSKNGSGAHPGLAASCTSSEYRESMFRRPRGWRKETKKQVSRIYDISPNCSQKSTQKEGKRVATSELNIWTYDVTTMKLFQTKRLFRTKVANSIWLLWFDSDQIRMWLASVCEYAMCVTWPVMPVNAASHIVYWLNDRSTQRPWPRLDSCQSPWLIVATFVTPCEIV